MKGSWWKWVLVLVLGAVMLHFFWPLVHDFRKIGGLLRTAHWPWLAVAAGAAMTSYYALAWLNRLCLQPFPGHVGIHRLAAVLTAVAFIEVAIPIAGVSGFLARCKLLGRDGYTAEASSFTFVLESIYLVIAMTSVGAYGIVALVQMGTVSTASTTKLMALAVVVAVVTALLWRMMHSESQSRRALRGTVALWNRLGGRWKPVDYAPLEVRLAEFQGSLEQLKGLPKWPFFAAAYGRVVLDVFTLWCCFELFGHPVSVGALLTGYATMQMMSAFAALPGGLAFADVSLPTVFARLGVPGEIALAAGLLYRFMSWWFMRLIGWVCFTVLLGDLGQIRAEALSVGEERG